MNPIPRDSAEEDAQISKKKLPDQKHKEWVRESERDEKQHKMYQFS